MALTPEQQKTIRLARVMYRNMWENQLGPALKEFAEMQQAQLALAPPALRPTKPGPAELQEDPAERAALDALLAEVGKPKGETR